VRGRYSFFLALGEDLAEALCYHVRYEMHWGHTTIGHDGQAEVTRAEYNEAFGVEVPEAPEIPDAVIHVWSWWWELSNRRKPGGESLAPLTYSEIYHWSSLTRTQITPSEIGMMIQMDDAYLRTVAEERKEQYARNRDT
jgi:hypothetical protein